MIHFSFAKEGWGVWFLELGYIHIVAIWLYEGRGRVYVRVSQDWWPQLCSSVLWLVKSYFTFISFSIIKHVVATCAPSSYTYNPYNIAYGYHTIYGLHFTTSYVNMGYIKCIQKVILTHTHISLFSFCV